MAIFNIVIEAGVPLAIGLLVSAYLRGALGPLLDDLCGTMERSDFWLRVTTVLVTGFPLMLVLVLGRGDALNADAASIARTSLTLTTIGIVCAVGAMSRLILKSVPAPSTLGVDAEVAK